MKFNQHDLENRVSSGNFNPPKPPVVDMTYDPKIATLAPEDAENFYLPHVWKYASQFSDWATAKSLKDAIVRRGNGESVLSMREWDMVARQDVDLNNRMLKQTLFGTVGFGTFFTEGAPQEQGNAYILRAILNRGVTWRNTLRDSASEIMRKNGDDKLQRTIELLTEKRLPPWPEELQAGCHEELLKPEWQTWQQFRLASSTLVKEVSFDV